MITEEQFEDWKKRLKERFEELFNQNHLLNEIIDNISIHTAWSKDEHNKGNPQRCTLTEEVCCGNSVNSDKSTDNISIHDEPEKSEKRIGVHSPQGSGSSKSQGERA